MPEDLDVLGRAGYREPHLLRESIDMTGTLGQEVEDFEAPGMRERLADTGELTVEAVLKHAVVVHGRSVRYPFPIVNCAPYQ